MTVQRHTTTYSDMSSTSDLRSSLSSLCEMVIFESEAFVSECIQVLGDSWDSLDISTCKAFDALLLVLLSVRESELVSACRSSSSFNVLVHRGQLPVEVLEENSESEKRS